MTRECYAEKAKEVFEDTCLNITCLSRPYLGSPVGSEEFVCEFMSSKVDGWIEEMARLGEIELSQPHAVFSALTKSMNRWTFMCRTVPCSQQFMEKIESCVQRVLLPVLLGGRCGTKVRRMVSLPARLGGIGIRNCVLAAPMDYEESVMLCTLIIEQLVSREYAYDYESECRQMDMKNKIV